jgi:hypothetical protein
VKPVNKKFTNSEILNDIDPVIERISKVSGENKKKNVAKLLGLLPSDFTNRKKRGTLLTPIVKWAIDQNVDLNWLLTGKQSGQSREHYLESRGVDNVSAISPGVRMARLFMDQFPDEALDDEGMRKLANIFQKLYDARLKDIESQILNEMPADIVKLAKGE